MRERKTKRFRELLAQYESMTNREKVKSRFFFKKLMPNAKNFVDWTVIYSYGGDSVRKDALLKMIENAICGLSRSEIQLNILELFIVIDSADKDGVLKRYLKRFHKEQDFLFVLDEADRDDDAFRKYVNEEMEKYGVVVNPFYGLDERIEKNEELLRQSTFDPPAWFWFWVSRESFSWLFL